MPCEFTLQRSVQFCEADAAGIAHFSNFFRYMEECEHAFLKELGCTVWGGIDQTLWPRVDARCSYLSPIPVATDFTIRLLIVNIANKSIDYQFQFHVDERMSAVGQMTVLAARVNEEQTRIRACALPDGLRQQISCAPQEELYER